MNVIGYLFLIAGAMLLVYALLPDQVRFRDSRFANMRLGSFKISTIYGEDGAHSTPYMTRIELGQTRLHIFYRGDADPDPHDHPLDFWTFPLTSYVEEVVSDGKTFRQIVPSWRWTFRSATHCHRVIGRWDNEGYAHTKSGNIYTIVRRTGSERPWGFLRNRDGNWCWTPWKEYVYGGGKHAPCEPTDG